VGCVYYPSDLQMCKINNREIKREKKDSTVPQEPWGMIVIQGRHGEVENALMMGRASKQGFVQNILLGDFDVKEAQVMLNWARTSRSGNISGCEGTIV